MESAQKPARPLYAYCWPLVLFIGGTIIPLAVGFALAWHGMRVPQCPSYTIPEEVESGSCIIGANMSGVYILLAIPFAFIAQVAAIIWALVIWRRRRKTR